MVGLPYVFGGRTPADSRRRHPVLLPSGRISVGGSRLDVPGSPSVGLTPQLGAAVAAAVALGVVVVLGVLVV